MRDSVPYRTTAKMAFYLDDDQELRYRIVLVMPEPDGVGNYKDEHHNFTGVRAEMDDEGNIGNIIYYVDAKPQRVYMIDTDGVGDRNPFHAIWSFLKKVVASIGGPGGVCYDFSCSNNGGFGNFWSDFFGAIWNGFSGAGVGIWNGISWLSGIFSDFWTGIVGSSGDGTGITTTWLSSNYGDWAAYGWGLDGWNLTFNGEGTPPPPNLDNQPIVNNWFNLLESLAGCLSSEDYVYFDNHHHLIPALYLYSQEFGCASLSGENIVEQVTDWYNNGASNNSNNTPPNPDLACAANYYQFINVHGFESLSVPELQGITGGSCSCGTYTQAFEKCVLEMLGLSGQDWEYDADFWEDPNQTFPTQDLPSYQDFYDGFPKNEDGTWMYGADNIYELVGGDVLQAREDYPTITNNTCALKVSIGLNEAGVDIPCIAGQTLAGEDGKCYFLNARALAEWMKKTFSNFEEYDDTDYNSSDDVHALIGGQKGIAISVFSPGSSFSGHADIYLGNTCSISPNGTNCDFGGTVYFWPLN